MRSIWIILVMCLLSVQGALAIGMGMAGSSIIVLQKGETQMVHLYFRGSVAEGAQNVTMFMATTAGILMNGVERNLRGTVQVRPNENTNIDVALKGVVAGTYDVTWGVISSGGGAGFAMDAAGQAKLKVIVGGSNGSSNNTSGGGPAASPSSGGTSSSCYAGGGRFLLQDGRWVCVGAKAVNVTNATVPVVVPENPANTVNMQDVAGGEGGIVQGEVQDTIGETLDRATSTVESVVKAGDVAKPVLMGVLVIGLLAMVLQMTLVYYARRNL